MNRRNLLLFFVGNSVTFLGNSIFSFLVSWWILKETGSSTLMGTILMFSTIPNIFFYLYFGKVVDQHNKKRILILTDFMSGIICFLAFFILKDKFIISVFSILFIALNINNIMFSLASKSIISLLVDKDNIIHYNAISTVIKKTTKIVGPFIAALLVMYINPSVIILFNGISFILSGISEMFLYVSSEKNSYSKNINIKEGFRFIKNESEIMRLVIMSTILNFILVGFNLYLPYISINIMHSDLILPVLLMAETMGALAGPFIVELMKRYKYNIDIYTLIILCGISLLFTVLTLYKVILVLSIFLFSVFLTIFNINLFTLLQQNVPSNLSGRVFGVVAACANILSPIGNLFFGVMGDFLGKYCIFTIGILLILVSVGMKNVDLTAILKFKVKEK